MSSVERYDRLIRRLRSDPRLWDKDGRVSRILGMALERRASLRKLNSESKIIGPYSGLTKQELRRTVTCETDWY